jgi:hypothetical protein
LKAKMQVQLMQKVMGKYWGGGYLGIAHNEESAWKMPMFYAVLFHICSIMKRAVAVVLVTIKKSLL